MRRSKKSLGLPVAVLVCCAVMAVCAVVAVAEPGFTTACHGCHGRSGAAPTVTLVSNDGTTATYHVDATALWEVFDAQAAGAPGTTKVASGTAPGGTFSGAAGHTFTVEQENAGGFGVTAVGANVYTISPNAGANGQITPFSAQAVAGGDQITFTIQAAEGYKVSDVLVDGSSVGAVSTYKFSSVGANHTIAASFAVSSFTLTYAAGPNGTISGISPQVISAGSSGTAVTAVPDPGYRFASWSDGVTTAVRTDANVSADKTMTASFEVAQKATSLSLKASTTSLVHGKYLSLTASLKGGVPAGTKVVFKVKAPGKSAYATIASVSVSSKGSAIKKYRVAKKGAYSFKAVYAGSASFKASASTVVKVRSR